MSPIDGPELRSERGAASERRARQRRQQVLIGLDRVRHAHHGQLRARARLHVALVDGPPVEDLQVVLVGPAGRRLQVPAVERLDVEASGVPPARGG